MKTVQAILFSLVSTGGRAEKADGGKPGISGRSSVSGFLGLLILALILALLVAFATGTAYAQGAGKALEFDGVDDYVEVPSSASLNSSQVTLEAWVYLNSPTPPWAAREHWHIIHKPFSEEGDIHPLTQYSLFFAYDSSQPAFDLIINSSYQRLDSNVQLALNTWHFIVGTYDGTDMKIYVDGELKNSLPVVGSVSSYSTGLTIGRHYHITNWVIDGIIDEVRIWNVALTESHIREMMCKKITSSNLPSGLAWSNLNAYWRFDESSGTSCTDHSGNGNTGTMTNMDPASDRVWSGAAIGDASAYDYTGSDPADFSASLAHSDGDNITATGDGGTVTGIQVYRVDATSMRTDATQPTDWVTMDPLRYWGAFIVGSSPTYTVTYNYNGHPGITEEGPNDLALAYRDDHADNSWANLGATWDPGANTLTKTGQTGTEYALGSGPTGTVTLVDQSPPLTWNYLLTHNNGGTISQWIYIGASIAGASVDGGAQGAGWSVQSQTSTQVIFSTITPLTSGSLTGFHLTGTEGGTGSWSVGTNSGSIEGPAPSAGTVTLVDQSPPLTWNYLLTHNSGDIPRWTYTGSEITGASVDGGAQAAGWSVQSQTSTYVVFVTATPLTSGSLTGFHITGTQIGTGSWSCGSNSGGVEGPLPVELSSFTATADDHQVTLRWRTKSEMDNLGFHVYRALAEDGHYKRLTAEVIGGAGNTSTQQAYSFTDLRLTNGVTYWYKLEDVAFDGTRTMHGPIAVTPQTEEPMEIQALPTEFGLSQNVPNPFNPRTAIAYQLPEASEVRLTVCNAFGRKVQVLVDGFVEAGYRSAVWDAKEAASGVYFIQMEAGDFVEVRKMVLIR